MKLPNADKSVIERAKIVDYLLNAAHPDNGGKAKFFEEMGFRREKWEALALALRTLAVETNVAQSFNSAHGEKHVVIGSITSPRGKSAMLKTIWIVDSGLETARLVTAYPHE